MKSAWFFKTRAILQNVSHLINLPRSKNYKKMREEIKDRGAIQKLETKHFAKVIIFC